MDSILPPLQPQPDTSIEIERDSIAKMCGEFLREAGLLVAVFIPLDLTINGHPLTIAWSVAMIGIPMFLFILGMAIERKRRQ